MEDYLTWLNINPPVISGIHRIICVSIQSRISRHGHKQIISNVTTTHDQGEGDSGEGDVVVWEGRRWEGGSKLSGPQSRGKSVRSGDFCVELLPTLPGSFCAPPSIVHRAVGGNMVKGNLIYRKSYFIPRVQTTSMYFASLSLLPQTLFIVSISPDSTDIPFTPNIPTDLLCGLTLSMPMCFSMISPTLWDSNLFAPLARPSLERKQVNTLNIKNNWKLKRLSGR